MAKATKGAGKAKQGARTGMSKLRFTGELPTEAAIRKFPNWEHALDEEGLPGQDESTLRPADEQEYIDIDTALSAAVGITPDGTKLTVLLRSDGVNMFLSTTGIDGIHIIRGSEVFDVDFYPTDWLSDDHAKTPLIGFDPTMLPLRVTSVLPGAGRKKRLEVTLMPDGQLLHGAAARKATFTYPKAVRPSDLIRVPRDSMLGSSTFIGYAGPGLAKRVGRSDCTITRTKGGMLRMQSKGWDEKNRLISDALFDERTLLLQSLSCELNGTKRKYTSRGKGASAMPKRAFVDASLVLYCVPLVKGRRMLIRTFSAGFGTLRYCVATVQRREEAPGQPGSMAWRVLVEAGLRIRTRLWLDVESRELLASQTGTRDTPDAYTYIRKL